MKKKIIPFVLSLAIIALDQITKAIIVAKVPINTIGFSALGDFFQIWHVRNTAIAFSLGTGLPDTVRAVAFINIPIVLLTVFVIYYLRSNNFTTLQSWAFCGIVGGGLANLLDRVIRPEGVVDFLSVKFYGLFGLDRFPTFNVADSSIVVCGILFVISILFFSKRV